jgi:hypothetical protein
MGSGFRRIMVYVPDIHEPSTPMTICSTAHVTSIALRRKQSIPFFKRLDSISQPHLRFYATLVHILKVFSGIYLRAFILAYPTTAPTIRIKNTCFISELVSINAMRMFWPTYLWWYRRMIPAIMIVTVDPTTFLTLHDTLVRI